MISFPYGTTFEINFDKLGNVVVYGIHGGWHKFDIMAFSDIDEALEFGKRFVRFCEDNQTKVPDAFTK